MPTDDAELKRIKAAEETWKERTLRPALEKLPERTQQFDTLSWHPTRRLYTPRDLGVGPNLEVQRG